MSILLIRPVPPFTFSKLLDMAPCSALTTAFLSSFTLSSTSCGKPFDTNHPLPIMHIHIGRNHPLTHKLQPRFLLQLFNARGEMTVRTLESLFGLRHLSDAQSECCEGRAVGPPREKWSETIQRYISFFRVRQGALGGWRRWMVL
ncbi:hypothetical protein BDQ17DRAFT_1379438, partial [Cyathus striatus]